MANHIKVSSVAGALHSKSSVNGSSQQIQHGPWKESR